METYIKNFINRLFEVRIKQIDLIKNILSGLMIIYLIFSFTAEEVHHIIKGLFYLLFATISLLNSLENKILKKKVTHDFDAWLLGGVLFFIIGIIVIFDIW